MNYTPRRYDNCYCKMRNMLVVIASKAKQSHPNELGWVSCECDCFTLLAMTDDYKAYPIHNF